MKSWILQQTPLSSFTKEVSPRLAKRPLKTNGRLANLVLTSLVKSPLLISLKVMIDIDHANLQLTILRTDMLPGICCEAHIICTAYICVPFVSIPKRIICYSSPSPSKLRYSSYMHVMLQLRPRLLLYHKRIYFAILVTYTLYSAMYYVQY